MLTKQLCRRQYCDVFFFFFLFFIATVVFDRRRSAGLFFLPQMIARGKNASDLFPAVVKNVACKNIEVSLKRSYCNTAKVREIRLETFTVRHVMKWERSTKMFLPSQIHTTHEVLITFCDCCSCSAGSQEVIKNQIGRLILPKIWRVKCENRMGVYLAINRETIRIPSQNVETRKRRTRRKGTRKNRV